MSDLRFTPNPTDIRTTRRGGIPSSIPTTGTVDHARLKNTDRDDAHPQYALTAHTHENLSLLAGELGHAESSSVQSGITTVTDITDLSVTVDIAAGRRIRITLGVTSYRTNPDGTSAISIREGSTDLREALYQPNIANEPVWVQTSVILTPSAGAHTYKGSIEQQSGTGSTAADGSSTGREHFILVEDIGAA